jgi:ABC-type Mn2+/Zn2+ transport system permease subunit
MLMFLLSLVFVAAVSSIGAVVVRTMSINPLSILARAAAHGRYVRLGSP